MDTQLPKPRVIIVDRTITSDQINVQQTISNVPPNNKKFIILGVVIFVLLCIGGGVAGFIFFPNKINVANIKQNLGLAPKVAPITSAQVELSQLKEIQNKCKNSAKDFKNSESFKSTKYEYTQAKATGMGLPTNVITVETEEIKPKDKKSYPFFVDEQSQLLVSLEFSSKNLPSVTLSDPKGNTILPYADSTFQEVSNTSDQGGMLRYVVPSASIGAWTLVIDTNNQTEEIKFLASVTNISAVNATAVIISKNQHSITEFPPEESAQVCAYVSEGEEMIVGAEVTMTDPLFQSDKTPQKREIIKLYDDGKHGDDQANDGLYAVTLDPFKKEGMFFSSIKVVGKRPSNNVDFQSITSVFGQVLYKSIANFKSDITTTAVDTNNDGLFENLIIKGKVDIRKAGKYQLHAYISEDIPEEKRLENEYYLDSTYKELNFSEGTHEWSAEILGSRISDHKKDGPYLVERLQLSYEDVNHVLAVDSINPHFKTDKYTASQFQRAAFRISGNISEEPIDINGDAKYDLLRIKIPVNVVTPGIYYYQGALSGEKGEPVTTLSEEVTLKEGENILNFDFNGYEINISNYSGKYHLIGVVISGATAQARLFDSDDLYTTKNYSYDQFIGVVTLEVGVSPSSAGTVSVFPLSENNDKRYAQNTTVVLEAKPSTGKQFLRWSENGATRSIKNPLSLILEKSHNLTAEFK